MDIECKEIKIPVTFVDGRWVMSKGGDIPVVPEGTVAEVRIHPQRIKDKQPVETTSRKFQVKFLDEDTELRVALTIRFPFDRDNRRFVLPYDATRVFPTTYSASKRQFVSIRLAGPSFRQKERAEPCGGLWLSFEGTECRDLITGLISLPKVGGLDEATSLNHAFTLLSEEFEPWRNSHTGSIYDRVYYQDGNCWYPLKHLRSQAIIRQYHEAVSVDQALLTNLRERTAEELRPMLA